jgi:hypothetical protein
LGVGVLTYFVIAFPAVVIWALLSKNPFFIAFALLLPLSGYLSMRYFQFLKLFAESAKARFFDLKIKNELILERKKLTDSAFSGLNFNLR